MQLLAPGAHGSDRGRMQGDAALQWNRAPGELTFAWQTHTVKTHARSGGAASLRQPLHLAPKVLFPAKARGLEDLNQHVGSPTFDRIGA